MAGAVAACVTALHLLVWPHLADYRKRLRPITRPRSRDF